VICANVCPVFPERHVQHVSHLHPKFPLRPHHVWMYGRHQSASAEIRREKKKDRKKEETIGQNIMSASAMQGGHNKGRTLRGGWLQFNIPFQHRTIKK